MFSVDQNFVVVIHFVFFVTRSAQELKLETGQRFLPYQTGFPALRPTLVKNFDQVFPFSRAGFFQALAWALT